MKIQDVNKEKLSSAMKQYYDIKMQHLDTVVFFQLGDFYELFFEDAIRIANLLELTLTKKSAGLDEKIPMAGVPQKALNDYLKKLMNYNEKVAIVDQVDDLVPGNKVISRKIRQIITPGTFHNEFETENNYIGALLNDITPKIAYTDLSTADAYNMEFININHAIEEIIKLKIKEIVVDFDLDNDIEDMLSYYKITVIKANEIKSKINSISAPGMSTVNNLLLNYLQELNHDISHINKFEYLENEKFMKIPMSTQKQLELVETLKSGEYVGSLFWYLNKTNTAMGRRLLKRWITRPLLDVKEIISRQNIVEHFMQDQIITSKLVDELSKIYDFERIIGRVSDNIISPKEMWQLKVSIERLSVIKDVLESTDNAAIVEIGENIDAMEDLKELLIKSIQENALLNAKNGEVIQHGFNQEIDRLREIKNNSTKMLLDLETKEKESTGIKTLKVKYNKVFGYFIEVTNSQLNLVPDNYIRKQTMSNCERYITDELKEVENDILNAEDLVIKLENEVYQEIKSIVAKEIPRLKNLAVIISKIDVLIAFSRCSQENNLIKPEFVDTNEVILKDSAHPIVKKMVNEFIVNDIILDKNINTLLITGPNMSGKSTYMRQLALIVIMAQIGMFVPASEAKLKIFDQIFTRIGASDDISQGQSTFMVEMSETAYALKYLTNNSLLLFDELGRGTSTYDGIALAKAIIEYLEINYDVKTLFSTHYHELTDLEDKFEKIKNIHVKAEESDEGLMFYHKVIEGSVQKSYGIEVASLAKLPVDIIQNSKKYINELELSNKTSEDIKVEYNQNLENEVISLKSELEKNKEILKEIDNIDINNLTPMQAFSILNTILQK